MQVVDYLNELTKALTHIVRPAYGHIDNNHEGLTREQTTDLIRVGDEVEAIYRRINAMLTTNDFGDIDLVLSMRDRLFETISDAIKSELRRFNTSGKGSTKASMLYLTILNETRTMVLQLRNLLKAQRHFLETKGVIKSWLYCSNKFDIALTYPYLCRARPETGPFTANGPVFSYSAKPAAHAAAGETERIAR